MNQKEFASLGGKARKKKLSKSELRRIALMGVAARAKNKKVAKKAKKVRSAK